MKVASIYKYFYRRGAKLNWCRINSLFRPYQPTEGNLKRKSALFSKWYKYLHKEVTTENKIRHNFDFYYLKVPKIYSIPKAFRILFQTESTDSSLLDMIASSPESDSSDDDLKI